MWLFRSNCQVFLKLTQSRLVLCNTLEVISVRNICFLPKFVLANIKTIALYPRRHKRRFIFADALKVFYVVQFCFVPVPIKRCVHISTWVVFQTTHYRFISCNTLKIFTVFQFCSVSETSMFCIQIGTWVVFKTMHYRFILCNTLEILSVLKVCFLPKRVLANIKTIALYPRRHKRRFIFADALKVFYVVQFCFVPVPIKRCVHISTWVVFQTTHYRFISCNTLKIFSIL